MRRLQQVEIGVKAVIFDLDGTLIDTAPDIVAAANRMLRGIGLSDQPFDTVKSFIGNGVPRLVESVMKAHDIQGSDRHDDLVQSFLRHYNAALAQDSRPYPNLVPMLDALKADGCALGVCTNKLEAPGRDILSAFALDAYFDVVVGGDSLAVKKPDPAPLLHAFDAVSGSRRLFVGDSEVDSETAVRARVPFALFTEGYRKSGIDDLPHDFAFSDFADLPGIVRRAFSDEP